MATTQQKYRSTESKYKGGAHEMYVTYDLDSKTSSGSHTTRAKVKRVYIAGEVKNWKKGTFKKRSGREAYGVLIEYEQTRQRYRRGAYTGNRGETSYQVQPASVGSSSQIFRQVVEVSAKAANVHFYSSSEGLPAQYRSALQNIR
jgi:hypothetical protein